MTVEAGITLASRTAEHPSQRHPRARADVPRMSSRHVNLDIGPFITDGFYYDFGNIDAKHPRAAARPREAYEASSGRSTLRAPRDHGGGGRPGGRATPTSRLVTCHKGKGAEGASVGSAAARSPCATTSAATAPSPGRNLCRGPHLPSASHRQRLCAHQGLGRLLERATSPTISSSVSTAPPGPPRMTSSQHRERAHQEAERRDHRRLGASWTCTPSPVIGPGLVIVPPQGHPAPRDRVYVTTDRHGQPASTSYTRPRFPKGGLFHTSGHLPYYADTMFPPMLVDEEHLMRTAT